MTPAQVAAFARLAGVPAADADRLASYVVPRDSLPSYGPRTRRSKADMAKIRAALVEILQAGQPMTVRQVFYQAVSRRVVEKTEGEYKKTVGRLLTEMRLDREIPFGWIADNTRWMRKLRTHSSAADAVTETARTYRRALWDDQEAYVEIWCEKDALAGVLKQVTYTYDVPLMVSRGYASISFLSEAAEAMEDEDRPPETG